MTEPQRLYLLALWGALVTVDDRAEQGILRALLTRACVRLGVDPACAGEYLEIEAHAVEAEAGCSEGALLRAVEGARGLIAESQRTGDRRHLTAAFELLDLAAAEARGLDETPIDPPEALARAVLARPEGRFLRASR